MPVTAWPPVVTEEGWTYEEASHRVQAITSNPEPAPPTGG
jgi:hypothetical protein